MSDDDQLWYAFGFDRPGDPKTPAVPENLAVTAGGAGSGTLFANWDDARRAEGYRLLAKDAGGQLPAEKLSDDSEAVIAGLAGGTQVSITVSARNAAGESQPCAAATTAVP